MTESTTPKPQDSIEEQATSNVGFFARLYWIMFGVAALFFSWALILKRGNVFSNADAIYWCLAASILIVRYLDIKFCQGTDSSGDKMTTKGWWCYVALFSGITLAGWIIAHILAAKLF